MRVYRDRVRGSKQAGKDKAYESRRKKNQEQSQVKVQVAEQMCKENIDRLEKKRKNAPPYFFNIQDGMTNNLKMG